MSIKQILVCDICGKEIFIGEMIMILCTGMDEDNEPVTQTYCNDCRKVAEIMRKPNEKN